MKRILRSALRLTETVIESARLEDESIVLVARPYERVRRRCPVCGRACAAYDGGGGPRRWRTLDLGASRCYLEYAPARVSCPGHGVRVESVPWARHGSRFSRPFEDRVAWMTVRCATSAVARACRVEWHSVGGICDRAFRDLRAVEPGIGNARAEATNNKVKVTVKMGYGFRNIDNLIALLMLRCSDIKPSLPWERPAHVGKAA